MTLDELKAVLRDGGVVGAGGRGFVFLSVAGRGCRNRGNGRQCGDHQFTHFFSLVFLQAGVSLIFSWATRRLSFVSRLSLSEIIP